MKDNEITKAAFEEMCKKAGVKKEALCDTVFTRQFKVEMTKEAIVTRLEYILGVAKTSGNCPILKNQLQYLLNELEKEGDIKG
jgi:hypothetical protein